MLKPLSLLAVAATLWFTANSAAFAEIKDYEFQLVQNEIKSGEAIVAVRIVHKRSGKLVPEAVIFSKRLDMAPEKHGDDDDAAGASRSGRTGRLSFQD
jgi:hypothetical protein